jgi:site-specific recombinase XerD
MKVDPYKHRDKYLRWKERVKDGIPGVRKENSDIILQYINDMECGLNVSSKSAKGARSHIRLNNLIQRLVFLAKQFEMRSKSLLTELSEEMLIRFFNNMRTGVIRRRDGKQYQSVADYVKPFKAFWHWYMKVNRKRGIKIPDITEDLDVSKSKPRWVYLTEDQIRKLCDNAKPEYRVLMMFLYDTGIRSPTELVNRAC